MVTAFISVLLVAQNLPLFKGEEIMTARLEAGIGGKLQYVFYTKSGKRVPPGFIKHPGRHVVIPTPRARPSQPAGKSPPSCLEKGLERWRHRYGWEFA